MKAGKLNGSLRRLEPDEDDRKDGIMFDKQGRMEYHPDFHTNQGKLYTLDEKIYIAKYYDMDGARKIGFALGRTEKSVANTKCLMNKSGESAKLAALSDDEWLELIGEASA